MGLTLLLTFLILLLTGLPIVFSAALTSVICFYLFDFSSLTTVSHVMYSGLNSFTLIALPLFIIVGSIMGKGNLVKYIFAFANSVFKNFQGGLAIAAILTSAVFAAISGSSLANAAALAMILLPYMVRYGYGKDLSAGVLAVGGTLGILIPPSVTMILYGSITEQSVGELFMAGLIPGLFAALVLSVFTYFWAGHKIGKPEKTPLSATEIWTTFKEAFPILLAPVIIIGGIYLGIFTPDESAAVAAIYCLLITIFYYKTIKPREIFEVFTEAACSSGMIMIILSGVMLFGYVITISQIPQQIFDLIIAFKLSPIMFMIFVNILLLVLGCFLDVVSVMLITIPILYPVFMQLGFNPIHLAVIYTINMELGTITPPVGMNLFAIAGSTDVKMPDIVKGVLPYMLVMVVILIIVIAFPGLSTWLPSKMY